MQLLEGRAPLWLAFLWLWYTNGVLKRGIEGEGAD